MRLMRLLPILLVLPLLAGCAMQGDETAHAVVSVDFNGFRAEDPQTLEDRVAFDPASRPTMDQYGDADRPDAYTLHDLMADWAQQTGADVDIRLHEAFGHQIEAVENVVAHSTEGGVWYWALSIDGEPASEGMGTVVVEEGAEYRWTFTRAGQGGADAAPAGQPEAPDGQQSAPDDQQPDGGQDAGGEPPSVGAPGGATASLAFDFGGFRGNGPQQTEHAVTHDPASRPTMPLYEEAGVERPDAYTVHDLVANWSAETGIAAVAGHHAAFGFELREVDGVVAHSTQGGSWVWALEVDGGRTTEGMGSIVVQEGTVYRWVFEHQTRP